LDSAAEAEFDALVNAAALVCGVPISLVSLVDTRRQWFKANVGLPGVTETPRESAFCAHAILGDDILEVADATQDPRFDDNPLVTGSPDIRFYAGAPLRLSTGESVGTLCVIDRVPRRLTATQRQVLSHLALAAAKALESRKLARSYAITQARFSALSEAAPLGVFATDEEGACTYTNARWRAIYGLTEQESLGTGWSRTLHPEDRDAVFAQWMHAAGHCADFDMEFRVRHDDGRVVHVRSVARPVLDDQGHITGHVGSVEDVTTRLQQRQALEAAHERITLATDSGGIGVWDFNVQTLSLTWDVWMHRLYGLPDAVCTDSYDLWVRHLHPEDRAAADEAFKLALQGGGDFELEFRVVWPDGSVHHLRGSGRVTRDAQGLPLRVVGVNWDVTAVRTLTRQLSEQHELLRVTLQSIGDAVITTDARGAVTWLNPSAERMTGWLSAEATGRPLVQVFHIVNEETRQPTQNPVDTCLNQGKVVGLANHTVLISREGDEYGIEDSAAPIRNEAGELLGVVLVFHDVTEQRRLSGEMSYRASHDALTGLINRAEFEARLRRTLNKAHEERSQHALMYIDLDQFKLVNDACGHSVGDQLPQQVAKLMGEVVRARDTLARLGGDEFAVILEHCTTEQAQRVAQQICDRMDDFRFVHDGRRFRIGTSIGLVPVDTRWANTAAVMQAADTSCYAAKEAGRNRVHAWFDTDLAMRARHGEMQWATRLEQAIDDNRFVLYAQKIHPLGAQSSGLHAEVLLRLLDTDGSLIPPGAFLPAAERFHLSSRIDRWVLQHALVRLRAAPNLKAVELLCINLSGQSIGDRAFHRHAVELLTLAGPAVCQRVCFEITETAAITNMADATHFIEQVRALGVRMALDDFGAGASSFGYLKTLPVDLLKIDGQFIKDLIDDPLDDAAVRCFVDVARVVGLKTVAEFVDRPEILQRVREHGIDYAQGFLLHRPEPFDQVLGSLAVRAEVPV
jgi:diguanylate cyclase (GGDEF)-like protein/PAS domain S-box-containing protein